ncbi:MAG TPA: hypothetical protein VMV10_02570 [Pirellulales bacterium]|nr:hypothetical protein [Pirellulales bacterium]HVA45490.1 hypothetical protein [Pirellulales bacterium]
MIKAASVAKATILFILAGTAQTVCLAQTFIDTDFSKGNFADLGWQPKGDWDVFRYPTPAANDPGLLARFAANKPSGSLSKTFAEIKNPRKLALSLDYGWGWGDANQPADGIAFMLLDSQGDGYIFEVHRCKATWAVQWARVKGNLPPKDKTWAREEIDATHASVRDGGSDLAKLIETARQLAAADALLAFESTNEPNNWGVTYQDEEGGGRAPSWLAVAKLQRDLYRAVKSDPLLKKYPVWSISEGGAEVHNVGLQFLTIPTGAGSVMPEGTRYADCANVHNYIYHPNSPGLENNKTWNAAGPTAACKVDGLFGNYGVTWAGARKLAGPTLPLHPSIDE